MKLVLVHCGRSADAGDAKAPDAGQQPLSPEGRRAVRETAAGLASAIRSLSTVVSSPMMAAVETAAIIARAFGLRATEVPQLAPAARPSDVRRWLAKYPSDASLLIVGHEPALSRLACSLLAGGGRFFSLKASGACMLKLEATPTATRATLHWVLTPRQLRRHGR